MASSLVPQGPGTLVLDLDTRPGFVAPGAKGFMPYAGGFLFSAATRLTERQLWRTDGTPAGTGPVTEIVSPTHLQLLGADGPVGVFLAGGALWLTDGTAAGTERVTSQSSVQAENGIAFRGGQMFFVRFDAAIGYELWSLSLTTRAVQLVADVAPGPASSSPAELTAFGAGVLFVADDGMTGREPWFVDANTGAVRQVADLWPGPVGSDLRDLTTIGGAVFATGAVAGAGAEPVRIAADLSVSMVADVMPGPLSSYARGYTACAGRVWFGADDGVHGAEVWSCAADGTGARLLADLEPGPTSSQPKLFAALGAQVLFSASTTGGGREPWVSDGTAAGTRRIADINPGSSDSMAVSEFVPLTSGVAVFAATDGVHGFEPWRTDGTTAGTRLLVDSAPGPAHGCGGLVGDGARAVFGSLADGDPWVTDGGVAGTLRLGRPQPSVTESGVRGELCVPVGDELLFFGTDGTGWRGLWVSDGTAANTRALVTSPAVEAVRHGVPCGDRVVFLASDAVNGLEPWVSDGTAAGTGRLADTAPGAGGCAGAYPPVRFQGRIWFGSSNGLWSTDGTRSGTARLPWPPGAQAAAVTGAWVAGDRLYFAADEPWVTDGTAAGTRSLGDLRPGPSGSNPREFFVARAGTLFFASTTSSVDPLPWVTDGTAAGTRPLALPSMSRVYWVVGSVGGEVIAHGAALSGRYGLVALDGTPGGVRFVSTGPLASRLGAGVDVGGSLLFPADDGVHGIELWSLAPGGTAQLVVDLRRGSASSIPGWSSLFTKVGERLVFAANDGVTGTELYVSDGRAAGTRLLHEFVPGPLGGASNQLAATVAIGSVRQVFVTGGDLDHGVELWRLDWSALGGPRAVPYGAGCAGPLGVPRLRAVGTPSLGAQRFELETSAAPSGSAVVFVLGPTAIDLSFGGGCRMLAGTPWATATVLAGVDDRARLALPVPTSTALRGLRLYAQSFVFSRGGAWNGGLAFSDGLGLLIER